MTLPLTPEILRASYAYLSETAPFRTWNLPDAEDVAFKVARDRSYLGWYVFERGKHKISISANSIGHTDSLMRVMAHEIIHLHEQNSGACKGGGTQHSAAFRRWAAQICKIHGFDPKTF